MKSLLLVILTVALVPLLQAETFNELFGNALLDKDGNPVATETLDGKIVGVYFSAAWCPPCRAFTPSLVQFQNSNKSDFEVVFVSSDRSAEDQAKYMKDYRMKFLTIAHGSPLVSQLKSRFAVRGIPKLVILAPDGTVITENGRGAISDNGSRAMREWKASLAPASAGS